MSEPTGCRLSCPPGRLASLRPPTAGELAPSAGFGSSAPARSLACAPREREEAGA